MAAERKALSGNDITFDNHNYQKTGNLHADSGLLERQYLCEQMYFSMYQQMLQAFLAFF